MIIIIGLLILLVATLIALVFSVNALWNTLKFGLPYVSTPKWAVRWLAEQWPLNNQDRVYELGCGDARVIAALARRHPEAQFIGIEIQWWPWLLAKLRTWRQKNVQIMHGDFLKTNLNDATLIYGFFITVMMPKVAMKLEESLRQGTPVISFGFAIPGWQAQQEIPRPDGQRGSKIRIYRS